LIGANREAIDKAEDRQLFDETMQGIGIETPNSGIAHSMEEALECSRTNRLSMYYQAIFYYGRNWRRNCLQY
jgi:hypothetical protein